MGWRFRRRVRVLPGITLNLSKSGASVSVGRRGAHVTVGKTGVRTTVGLPGTGISYTKFERIGRGKASGNSSQPQPRRYSRRSWIICWIIVALCFGLAAILDQADPHRSQPAATTSAPIER